VILCFVDDTKFTCVGKINPISQQALVLLNSYPLTCIQARVHINHTHTTPPIPALEGLTACSLTCTSLGFIFTAPTATPFSPGLHINHTHTHHTLHPSHLHQLGLHTSHTHTDRTHRHTLLTCTSLDFILTTPIQTTPTGTPFSPAPAWTSY
jgi:hypothetical protein